MRGSPSLSDASSTTVGASAPAPTFALSLVGREAGALLLLLLLSNETLKYDTGELDRPLSKPPLLTRVVVIIAQ